MLVLDELDPFLLFYHIGILAHLVLGNTVLEFTPELYSFGRNATLLELFSYLNLIDIDLRG